MELLYLSSSVLSLFFVLILAGKKKKSHSDLILIGWFVLLFSNVLTFYLIIKDMAPQWLIIFLDHSVFLQGPLLYFYTSALTGLPKKPGVGSYLHILPFICFLLISGWFELKQGMQPAPYQNALIFVKFTVPLIYILVSLRIIRMHRQRIENIYSSTNHLELRWLSGVLYGCIVLILGGATTMLLFFFSSLDIPQFGGQYLNISYSVFIILLGYFGFRQTAIFLPAHIQSDPAAYAGSVPGANAEKYHKTRLTDDFVTRTYEELLKYMDTEKPYTDNNLSLFRLSDQLGITENKLSQVINTQRQENFFEFVNRYRVEMVIDKMKRGEHRNTTLLGLAMDSGFNSKASFNRVFKKFTGLTPSDYLKTRLVKQL